MHPIVLTSDLQEIDTFESNRYLLDTKWWKKYLLDTKNEPCSILKKVFERKMLKMSNKHCPSKRKHTIVNRFPYHLQSTLSVCNTSTDKSTSFYPIVTYNLQLLSPKNTYKSITFSLSEVVDSTTLNWNLYDYVSNNGKCGRSKSLIWRVLGKWFFIHFPLLDYVWLEIIRNISTRFCFHY